ncbi:O-antigen polysaccharide polymerase Wzy [Salinicoccus roseus]|uniref:O-antigen polysaccharide polymerase Wzy n=1 Tax=Salinicoccus roseus TaxID=45670 RepID=UPI0023010710|nr:O-antigen polysaccharide polymerase Wzy [Salinicoccus roseus]
MKEIENSNYNYYILLNVIITLFVTAFSLLIYTINFSYELKLGLFGWLGNGILLWGVIIFKKVKKTYFNPYTIFFICYYLFSYGQIFLFSIGAEYSNFNLIRIFPENEIILYSIFFCVGTCFMLLGALVAIRKDIFQQIDKINEKNHENHLLKNAVKMVAWVMLFASAPVYLNNLISNMLRSINQGYQSLYNASDASSVSNIVDSLGMWFIASMFLLLVIYKSNKLARYTIVLTLGFVIVGSFIMGVRSIAMGLLFSLVFLYDIEVRKISKKGKLFLFFGILLIIYLLPVIQTFRGLDNRTISEFLNLVQEMYADNLLIDLIGELGGSMQPWLLTYDLIPDYSSFKLGESYIAAFFAVIPSFFLGGYSFTESAHLSGWLMEAKNMSYGPGFSILAESYYNFGWFGIVFMFAIGWLIFKFLSNNMFKGDILIYKNVFSAIALYFFITAARSSLYLGVRREVYAIIIPIFAIIIIYNLLKNRANK